MRLTRQQIDRVIEEHFRFEATDDVEGVLGSLTEDVQHQVIGSTAGELHGRGSVRPFYETLFADLKGEGVTPVRRLYGEDCVVDEAIWHGFVNDGRLFQCPGKSGRVSFRILHVFQFRGEKISFENVWCDLAAIQQQLGCVVR